MDSASITLPCVGVNFTWKTENNESKLENQKLVHTTSTEPNSTNTQEHTRNTIWEIFTFNWRKQRETDNDLLENG